MQSARLAALNNGLTRIILHQNNGRAPVALRELLFLFNTRPKTILFLSPRYFLLAMRPLLRVSIDNISHSCILTINYPTPARQGLSSALPNMGIYTPLLRCQAYRYRFMQNHNISAARISCRLTTACANQARLLLCTFQAQGNVSRDCVRNRPTQHRLNASEG